MRKAYVALLVILIALSISLFYVNIKSPVKVALIGNFQEERYSFATSSIIAGRIAEEDINSVSGIRGKKTELMVRDDDFKDPEETVRFLRENKIKAIITTAASKDLLQLKPYLEKDKIVCISVGATSTSLSKQRDYIYRILPDDESEIKALFNYMTQNGLQKDIALIYDKLNLEYKKSVETTIEKLGGKVTFQESWEGDSVNYKPSDVEAIKNKTILILSSARHTAFLIQKLRGVGIRDKIFGTSWGGDDYLLTYGGRASEGFTLVTPVDLSGEEKDALELTEKLKTYDKRNGLIPNGVYKGYKLLKKAYEDSYEKHISLKDALENSNFFDEYGDSREKELIFTIKNGQYTKLGGASDEGTKN